MIKRYCDQCGKEIRPDDDPTKPFMWYKIEIHGGFSTTAFDLCDECYKKLTSNQRKDNYNSKDYMMTDFSKYCPSCKHKHLDERWSEPCGTCLLIKGQIDTDAPVYYEEEDKK